MLSLSFCLVLTLMFFQLLRGYCGYLFLAVHELHFDAEFIAIEQTTANNISRSWRLPLN